MQPTIDYLKQPSNINQWQHIGLQGIADLCARISDSTLNRTLSKRLTSLPQAVLIPILIGLENEKPNELLTDAIILCAPNITTTEFDQNPDHPLLVAAIIRSLSGSTNSAKRNSFILNILKMGITTPLSVEILVAISGRAWESLLDESLTLAFLEALARNDAGQHGFDQILTDILFLPEIGKIVRQAFRAPQRSQQLALAIGEFLKTTL